jgi:predicted NUDIX family NTP pyrophosphohydrolase
MTIERAGILLYRGKPREILLIHMGGPFWAKKDEAAWSIPKGAIEANEEPLAAAQREFLEETGFTSKPPFIPLGRYRQNSSKYLSVWATEGDCDPAALVSTTYSMEWPPRSGILRKFPEADRAAWLARDEALRKVVKSQRPVLERFYSMPAR